MPPDLAHLMAQLLNPYDLYERHAVAGGLLQRLVGPSPATVLDVGGRAALLAGYVPYDVVAINPDTSGHVVGSGTTLPFADRSFDAVVSIDTLEHLPPAARAPFICECLRAARRGVVMAAPLGSPAHAASERDLDALHRQVHGLPHPYLAEHIAYGLPTLADITSWRDLPGVTASRAAFAGDFQWQAAGFARAIRAHQRTRLQRAAIQGWHQLSSLAIWHPVRLADTPQPTTNRFYLVLEKER